MRVILGYGKGKYFTILFKPNYNLICRMWTIDNNNHATNNTEDSYTKDVYVEDDHDDDYEPLDGYA